MVACLEEIAFRMGYITARDLALLARDMESSAYGKYLARVLEEEHDNASTRPSEVAAV
jgi:glucose-1-phosphate thymidylyltransferase